MYLVHWVEGGLDPKTPIFDPAILTHFMAKNCPKSAINGTPSHKQVWRLQNGGSVWIKVGSRQDIYWVRNKHMDDLRYIPHCLWNCPFDHF